MLFPNCAAAGAVATATQENMQPIINVTEGQCEKERMKRIEIKFSTHTRTHSKVFELVSTRVRVCVCVYAAFRQH